MGCATARNPRATTVSRESGALLPLHVNGLDIVDSQNRKMLLHGVNVASMEWTSDGQGRILNTIQTAVTDWHVNIVRVPLTQDRWFGKAPEQNDAGQAYKSLVQKVVDLCVSNHCYVILDLHWSDCNEWGHQHRAAFHARPKQPGVLAGFCPGLRQ